MGFLSKLFGGPRSSTQAAGSLVEAINQARHRAMMGDLAESPALTGVAIREADAMEKRGVLAHDMEGPLAGRLHRVGVKYAYAAETIGWGYRTAAEVVRAWLDDPPHREAVLGRFTSVGVAQRGLYWCAVFVR